MTRDLIILTCGFGFGFFTAWKLQVMALKSYVAQGKFDIRDMK